MDATIARFQKLGACTCRHVIDHPLSVDAVSGQEHRVFEVHCLPEDIGLRLGAPCSHGTDRHGTQHVAAVLGLEKSLPEAVTGVVLDADATATAGSERSMTSHVLETALTLLGAGLSVIPIRSQKRPALECWKHYQIRLPTPEEWASWVAPPAMRAGDHPRSGEWQRRGH